MSKKIIDYRIVFCLNIDLLEDEVNELLYQGYELLGAPQKGFIDGSNTNYQVMVLKGSWKAWRIWRLLEPVWIRLENNRSNKAYRMSYNKLQDKLKEFNNKPDPDIVIRETFIKGVLDTLDQLDSKFPLNNYRELTRDSVCSYATDILNANGYPFIVSWNETDNRFVAKAFNEDIRINA